MSYCINPKCHIRHNPDSLVYCQNCGTSLLIGDRYRLVRPLRDLYELNNTEIFEVDDRGTAKVMKVLNSDRPKLVRLFEQEAHILQRLQHPGIPRVDAYFVLSLNDAQKVYCLVMEKIEGQNLKQWLEENGSISETTAIDWLKQLLIILASVHSEKLLHRDIKPSNIMLRPDGQLVLIDFGTVRELTRTYISKLGWSDVTQVYSVGYTPLEQIEGQAVLESDFFALGRTFVHLLTGIYPAELPKNPDNQLIWRDRAPQTSAWLAHLIDQLIAPLPQNRPSNAQRILERLNDRNYSDETRLPLIEQLPTTINQGDRTYLHRPQGQIWRKCWSVLLASIAATSLVVGVRQLGILETVELQAFDGLMRLRQVEGADPRILVVTISEAEIQAQQQRQGSLSDRTLSQLLAKLEQYNPRTIGLDIYRDVAVSKAYPDLVNYLQTSDRFIGLCKISDPDINNPGIPPPPEVAPERIGFSDVLADDDNTVRRQILHLNPPATSPCTTQYAFSLQLALHYLADVGIESKVTTQGNLQVGDVVFERLAANSGAYKRADLSGYQVPINYRPYRHVRDIAMQVSLDDILKNRISPETRNELQGRLVLIGVTAPTSVNDYWFTPYSASQPRLSKQLPGVFLQAQMVSQILSTVLDRRPLLWVWSAWGEILWIANWSIVGGLLVWYCKQYLRLAIAIAVTLIVLYASCLAILLFGGWVPLVPPVLTLVFSATSIVIYRHYRFK